MKRRLLSALLACTMAATAVLGTGSLTVRADEVKVNYALQGVASASKSPISYWGPDKLIDGIVNRDASKPNQSRWSSESGAPGWVKIDLTEIRKFDEIKIAWENGKTRRFHIEMSDDDQTYQTIYTSEDLEDGHPMDTTIPLEREQFGRYIKITVDALIPGAYPSVSIYEVEINGKKTVEDGVKEFRANYALNCDASASRSPISYWGPDKLTDGIINRNASKPDQSRWSSESGAPGWVQIDLGEVRSFDELLLAWESGGTVEAFHIEASDDGSAYRTIYTAPNQTAGYPEDTSVYLDEAVDARYVKITVDKLTQGTYPSVSMYEVKVIGTKVMHNLARSASVTSNGDEAASVAVTNINDGKLDTRWGSSYGVGEKTVDFNFDEPQSIQSFILEWERKTPKDYKLEAEVDGEMVVVYSSQKVPKNYQEIINLDEAVETSHVKLTISDFLTKGSDRDGVVVDYPTVSLHEVEMFGERYDFPPRDQATTVQDIANEVAVDALGADDTEFVMPTVPDGYTIRFEGADYEQVITADCKVLRPIVDTEVVLNFEVVDTETGKKAWTPDIKLLVPGELNKDDSVNAKPTVDPELQQWFGRTGDFEVTDTSKIVVDPSAAEFKQAAELLAEDYKDIMKKDIEVVDGTKPAAGDFYFTKSNTNLDEETYILDIEDVVTIKADQYAGSYWATRSVLQILKQTNGTIAKGTAKDYPKYRVRGMMLDVARLPIEMRFLEDIVKTMSWYKMNDFQVHLNDNVFTQTNGMPDYSGFRLESNVPNLTNTDVYYTKDEFRNFINTSKTLGVNIVPEFDSPGHSGAFTRAKPEFARGYGTDALNGDYLDLDNKFDEILEFMKGVFAEYTTGDDPVYPEGTVVHIGTDEYKKGGKENFRRYQDALLKYVRDDLGYTPRVWGSQTENSGTTPITVEGVQMNLWYSGYANPKDMYELGYDVINTNDGDQYIVPGAGYYYDYLNKNHIYGNWQPNVVAGFKIPAGSSQMLGANFAVWNDKTGPVNDNGTSDVELFDRIYDIMPVYGAKLWGDIKDYSLSELNALSAKTNYAPNSNPTYQVESIGDTYVDYDFNNDKGLDYSGNAYNLTEQKNVSYTEAEHGDALVLNGGESYVETPVKNVGINTKVDFWINKAETGYDEEQILFESDFGTIKAVQKETGKFGFSRWQRDYSFNYQLPENEWVHITLVNEYTKTKLYVNDELVSELARQADKGNKWATLITPLEKIGSETNAFQGMIDDLVISKKDAHKMPENVRALAGKLAEAKGELAKTDVYTEASLAALRAKADAAAAILADWENADVEQALSELEAAIEGLIKNDAKEADKEDLKALIKYAEDAKKADSYQYLVPKVKELFEKALADAVKVNDNPAAAQAEVDAAYDTLLAKVHLLDFTGNAETLQSVVDIAGGKVESAYTKESWGPFKEALTAAEGVLENPNALQAEINAARDELQAKMDALVKITVNREKLEKLVADAEKYEDEIEKYTNDTAKAFTAALEGARDALETAEVQEEVNSAYSSLLSAIFGLREVPNKDKLDELLGKVKAMDLSVYSAKAASAVKAAYAQAVAVFEDENADQKAVDAAVAALEKAVAAANAEAGEEGKGDTSDNGSASDEKDNQKVASDNAGSKTTTTGKTANKTASNTAAKTGDSANAAVPAAAGLAAIAAVIKAWRKRNE